ncbi:M20 metallopeptidase family protein [Nocardioides mangrovi]|uniref:Amidohydrolase n=1 Tax=Nocardioides mangrovi TaxID=2874580 RepID=A0ABS7UFD0_9ACTN|nr:M20 family metallopeptidase [Nocardioides mangrovi]MBZ5739363.1 amidohydrolase [Nocardioides mangrovi]
MDLLDDARGLADDLVELRRRLHREPEVGLELPRTQAAVLDAIDGLGLEVTTGTGATSVTAVLRGGRRPAEGAPVVLLRGDMDALPMEEKTGLGFAAVNGAMHACGHDLHTASLVGAARLLHQHRDRLRGDVVLMFQPGEEGYDGAGVMVREGVLDAAGRRADAAYATHVSAAEVPLHRVTGRAGPLLAASHGLTVTVRGVGAHGSTPFRGRDPIVAMAEMITSLQAMVTRRFDVFDPVVLTVGVVHAGTRRNIIPDTAQFEATVRRFSDANEARLTEAIHETLHGVARAHGVEVEIEYVAGYPLTVNDPAEAAFAARVTEDLLGPGSYESLTEPSTASEDFSRVLAEVPGAMIFLGATPAGADPQAAPSNHDPRAVFDEAALPDGAALLATLAHAKLEDLAR